MTVEGTSKNRIISPGKVLHFYNSPPDSTVETLNEVFVKVLVTPPMGIKFFSQGRATLTLITSHTPCVYIYSVLFILNPYNSYLVYRYW